MSCTRFAALLTLGVFASAYNSYRGSQVVFQHTRHQHLPLNETYPEQWFTQPLDHFSHTGHSFDQRFWYSSKHYVAGGPIFILDGGETSGEDRLAFLDTGILNILANATGGYSIVLEHRYYGKSVPVKNFTTDSLRWLNNEQAAADSAHFIRNHKINGVPLHKAGPVIYYGGSYAGARAAHMRVLYPDIVFGAIGSSGVIHAQYSMPEYTDLIRNVIPTKCAHHIENTVRLVDFLLSIPPLRHHVKALFALEALSDQNFVQVLTQPLGNWQGIVWNSPESRTAFFDFCHYLGNTTHKTRDFYGHKLDFSFLGYARYVRERLVDPCEVPVAQCFSTDYSDVSLDAVWRLWLYQTCTQWGYYQSAPIDPRHPTLISRRITADSSHEECFKAFPPGEYNSIPAKPNVSAVNHLGDFTLTADRLALIDGEVDPWRPMTAHSQYAPKRQDTLDRPFKLIPGAVHHWDEYGLEDLSEEPPEIYKIHLEMIEFVQHWIKVWVPEE